MDFDVTLSEQSRLAELLAQDLEERGADRVKIQDMRESRTLGKGRSIYTFTLRQAGLSFSSGQRSSHDGLTYTNLLVTCTVAASDT